ncbi:MAG: hypothetical protein IT410_04620 [Candidatus Doudnabacteria bacterium]|nr:hypothetical protein [Candidatus Doudnabacteria bacterium]
METDEIKVNTYDINQLHEKVDDVLRYKSLREAGKLTSFIKQYLKEQKVDAEMSAALDHYLVLLAFIRILSISETQLFSLLRTNIQDSYSIPDYELRETLADRFSLLNFPEDGAEFLTKVTESLEANTEKFGTQTIGGWVKLYSQSVTRNSEKSGFNMVQFLQKNGTGLKEDQKVILLEVFKIYDSGKKWLAKYEALPVAQSEADIPENVLLDMIYGKEDEEEKDQPPSPTKRPQPVDGLKSQQIRVPQPASAVRAQAPQPISPAPTKPPVPISDQSTNSIPDKTLSPSTASQPETPPTTDEIVEKIKRDEAKPETVSRLQELLHKNITPVSSPAIQPEKAPDPQTLIDDKISELKKRINSNE